MATYRPTSSEAGAYNLTSHLSEQLQQCVIHNNLEIIKWDYTFKNRRLELQDLLLDIHTIWSFLDTVPAEKKSITYILEDIYDYIKYIFKNNVESPMPLYLERQFRILIDKLRTMQIYMNKFDTSGDIHSSYSYLTKEVQKIFFTMRTIIIGLEKVLVSYGNTKMEKVWEVQNMV